MANHYCLASTVKQYAKNVVSDTANLDLEPWASIVDSDINSNLSSVFENWDEEVAELLDADPFVYEDIPEQIRTIANLLTAAHLEYVKYASNQAEGNTNPYAKRLEDLGTARLMAIVSGESMIPGLTRIPGVLSSAPDPEFDLVYRLRNQSSFAPWSTPND